MSRAAASLCLIVGALALTGCGSDDEPATATRTEATPQATERSTSEPTAPERTATEPAAPTGTSDGTPEAEPERGGAAAPPATTPDTPRDGDDTPPAGSPAERFEKYCDEHPGACG